MRADQRDTRVLRAARDVLAKYKFTRTDQGDEVRFDVTGGAQPYVVSISRTWAHPPSCTCPDSDRPEVKGYCKHAIAMLTLDPEWSCQLLEVYL